MTDQELAAALKLTKEQEDQFFLCLMCVAEEEWVPKMNEWIVKNTESTIRVTAAVDAEDFIEWEIANGKAS